MNNKILCLIKLLNFFIILLKIIKISYWLEKKLKITLIFHIKEINFNINKKYNLVC